MVVREATPTRRLGPLKQNLFFKFVSSRSNGDSRRQAVGKTRQPIVNDLHIANLHSDKVWAERKLQEKRTEFNKVKQLYTAAESHRNIAIRDANSAWDTLETFPEYIHERDAYSSAAVTIRKLHAKVAKACADREEADIQRAAALMQNAAFKAAKESSARGAQQATTRLEKGLERTAAAKSRADHLLDTVKGLSAEVKGVRTELRQSVERVTDLQAAADWGEDKVEELEGELNQAEKKLVVAEDSLEKLEAALQFVSSELQEEKCKSAPKRGRPAGHKGADWLCEQWDTYSSDGKRQAFWRHCHDIKEALHEGGVENWLPSALAVVLDAMPAGEAGSWVDVLFSSRPFCKRKCLLIKSLRDILQAEWGTDVAQHALVEVGLSHSQYQGLRNAFSKSLFRPVNSTVTDDARAGMFSKRPWYTCPVLGTVFHMPEPLSPMWRCQLLMKETLAPLGLKLSVDGKISERSFTDTLRSTFERDAEFLKVFDINRPAHPCFGIDHATISGARDFTQGGITMGGCYKRGALLSEQKHVTLCIGLHHDDGKGLAAMLGSKEASVSAGESRPAIVGIAKEFEVLSNEKVLDMGNGKAALPCDPVCCLDFAAWRGITRKRGKCSALCACRGLACLQSYPGANGIPDLPTGDTLADFYAAQKVMQAHCAYGTEKMMLPSLQDATHILPPGWNFATDGPWTCSWCNEEVWTADGQYESLLARLVSLRGRAGTAYEF